jgi:hypothetical protein
VNILEEGPAEGQVYRSAPAASYPHRFDPHLCNSRPASPWLPHSSAASHFTGLGDGVPAPAFPGIPLDSHQQAAGGGVLTNTYPYTPRARRQLLQAAGLSAEGVGLPLEGVGPPLEGRQWPGSCEGMTQIPGARVEGTNKGWLHQTLVHL